MYLMITLLIFLFQYLNLSETIEHKLTLSKANAELDEAIPSDVQSAWIKYRDEVNIDLDLFTSGFASKAEQILNGSTVSDECSQGIRFMLKQGSNKKIWAIKALDSWGRFPPPGLFSGTASSLGSYDQCLSIETPSEYFDTQYCSVYFNPVLPRRPAFHNIFHAVQVYNQSSNLTPNQNAIEFLGSKAQFFYYIPTRIGVCLTTHCNREEIDSIVKIIARKMYLKGEVATCESKLTISRNFNDHQKIAIQTDYEVGLLWNKLPDRNNSLFISLFLAFSMKRNFISLFCSNQKHQELKCLNGIRALTMTWIVFGHTMITLNFHAFSYSFNIINIIKSFGVQALLNATFTVDTFFLISGLLTSFMTWQMTNGSHKKFNPFWFIVTRYLRLTPFMIIAMCATILLPTMGSGPLWDLAQFGAACEKNWWINMFYIQSFYKTEEICLFQSWWLSSDMFFHVSSIIVLIPLLKSQRLGIIINSIVISCFIVISAIINYTRNYPLSVLPSTPHVDEFSKFIANYFMKPWTHGPPFFIGLYLGYLVAKKKYIKITKNVSMFAQIMAIISMLIVLYAPYPLTIGKTWSKWAVMVYESTSRVIWSLSVSWIIYASASGHGGFINKFLSLPIFIPFARISYAVYLSHSIIIFAYMGSRRNLFFTDSFTAVSVFISHWVLCQIFGLIGAVFVEYPFINLQKLLLNNRIGKSRSRTRERNEDHTKKLVSYL
uniref:Nose resistant-to-fluoxetine protein N-terminal domain-containing protein n=1 Tax=Tetranychus urticae TaxID=32264 RepID=T1KZX1_TETUR